MSDSDSNYRYFAVTSPGLELLLCEELSELKISGDPTPGGVSFKGPLETLWSCALQSRIAESIRLRLKPFKALDFAALEQGLARLPWHAYLTAETPLDINVSCSESRLYHTGAIEERLRRVLDARWKHRSYTTRSAETPEPQKLFLRLVRNEIQVSIDATGERLHRRGYRTHVGAAPIRETLAAAALRALTRNFTSPTAIRLWDPCCGSGTLLCEWLQVQSGIWPGFATNNPRAFAFERWPIHPKQRFDVWKTTHRLLKPTCAPFDGSWAFGSDTNPKALSAARHNLEQAQVLPLCKLFCADFTETATDIPPHTAVITNLPYGVRLKPNRRQVPPFLALDALLRHRPDLRPALVVTTDRPPARTSNSWKAAVHFANGGLRVTAWILT